MTETTTGRRRTGRTALAISACLAMVAGAVDPARAAGPAPSASAEQWRPSACPPPAEQGSGPSRLKVTGPCAFEHTGEAECSVEHDDFLITLVRKARNGAELMLFINVERYVGPGDYKAPNDVWVGVKDGEKIYRWWSNTHEVTVGPESRSVTLKDVHLEPERVLIGCTGPQTNFQCDGRGDEPGQMKTISIVTGTIYCKAGGKTR